MDSVVVIILSFVYIAASVVLPILNMIWFFVLLLIAVAFGIICFREGSTTRGTPVRAAVFFVAVSLPAIIHDYVFGYPVVPVILFALAVGIVSVSIVFLARMQVND
ncbi:MAG: hypothetical protein WC379_18565 [Methanoregula sp.]